MAPNCDAAKAIRIKSAPTTCTSTALFLPLAAWLIASRRGEWNQLLAATLITVALAIPTLLVAATIEVYVWPHILEALSPVDPAHLTHIWLAS